MNRKTLSVLISLPILMSLFSFSLAQNVPNIYAPQTQNLNIIDTVALHTYCTLSKVFSSNERERCFTGATTNTIVEQVPVDLSAVNQSLMNDRRDIDILLNAAKEEVKTEVRDTQYITRYVNVGGVGARGSAGVRGVDGKQIVSSYQNGSNSVTFVYSDGSTFSSAILSATSSTIFGNFSSSSATNTIVIGNNIINDIAGSIQIGANNSSKLFLGADGFLGVASSTFGGARTSRLIDEQLRVGGRIRAQGFDVDAAADVAEMFPADEKDLAAGTIVMFSDVEHVWNTGGTASTSGDYSLMGVISATVPEKVMGVVATNPGMTLNAGLKDGIPVAFTGRVPVRVSAENGQVQKGDRITLSARESGVGMKMIGGGVSVGVALSSDSGRGVVLMLVKNENVNSNVTATTQTQNEKGLCIDEVCLDKSILKRVVAFFNAVSPAVTTTNENR